MGEALRSNACKASLRDGSDHMEVGSLVCAIAPKSQVFIVGRAIAGMGMAGVFGGAFMCVQSGLPETIADTLVLASSLIQYP